MIMRRVWDGFWTAFPAPSTLTAAGVTATWGLTGYQAPVALVGALLVTSVRLSLNPERWGEEAVK